MRGFLKLIFIITITFGGIWVGGLVWFQSQIAKEPTTMNVKTDAIVVLTGGSDRLREGLKLLNKKYGKTLFISGAGKGVRVGHIFSNVGMKMKRQLSNRVEIGYAAGDTKGNASEVVSWMLKKKYRSLRLVTSNYHMARAMLAFKAIMPGIQIIQHPVISKNVKLNNWWKYPGSRDLIIDEYNKYLVASVNLVFGK